MEPTPRDQRIKMLDAMTHAQLHARCRALGFYFDEAQATHTTNDELVSMILEAEQALGLVTR